MSRQKSNRTLLIEQERAARMEERKRKREEKEGNKTIREERRHQKVAEREAKRQARLKKRLTHESVVKNGVPKVQSGGTELGIHDAIAYSPLMICAGCVEAVREILDADGLCEKCKYEKEVLQGEHVSERLEALQSKAVPDQRDGGSGTMALAGQLSLLNIGRES
jgi:hypothetical protein